VDIEFPAAERVATIKRIKEYVPDTIEGVKVERIDSSDGFRFILADTTWLLIRFSGTEPLLRIYAESDSMERVETLLASGRKVAGV